MSTDRGADRPRLERSRSSRFRRVNAAVLVSLAAAAIGLGAANATQGPRLSSAEINTAAVVARAEQRLVLTANQPVADIDAAQVTVSPAAAIDDVSVDGTAITVRFADILDYDTDYTLRIDEVRGAFTSAVSTLSHRFSTPSVDVYTLLRDTTTDGGIDAPDRILRNSPTRAESEEVFEAPRIQEYAVTDSVLVAATQTVGGEPSLVLTSLSDGVSTPVPTPLGGPPHDLRLTEQLLGFRLGGEIDPSTSTRPAPLYVLDLTDASGIPIPVVGLDGAPLSVQDWTFVPGTTALVAQAADQQLYLVDPVAGTPPTPLGQHTEMRGFVPGTTNLIVADPLSGSIIDLADGTVSPLDLPQAEADADSTAGKIVMLGGDSYVQQFDNVDYSLARTTISSELSLVDPSGTRRIYAPPSETSRIRDFCVSPNGQFLAVEVIPVDGVIDGYDLLPAFSDMTTYFVELSSGAARRSVGGFLPSWCR